VTTTRPPRVAIVHDWLVNPGGAELVLRDLLRVFPDAQVFTLIDHMAADERRAIGLGLTTTSSLQNIPGIAKHYRNFLPLMPLAVRSLDVSGYDIVISNSHAIAKGITTTDKQLHICYCLSPMRYAWDLREPYLRASGLDQGIKGALARAMLERMRRWDLGNTHGVDAFITLSHFIAERIERAYGRESTVIYPPVDTDYFTPEGPREEFYLTASRFVQYKRIDLIAEAFRLLPDRQLIIVGDGPDAAKIRAAAGPNVTLVGRQSRPALRDYLRRARAFIFAAEEDFGIAPVEAQACGTPVIAYGAGGALETVRAAPFPTPTGVFFEEQSAEAIADAVRRFEASGPAITPEHCRANAERFEATKFREQIRAFVDAAWTAKAATCSLP
jgi:glycosyltransferase involved in cell wall biosynthesis